MKPRFFYLTQEQVQSELNRLCKENETSASLSQAVLNCYERDEYSESHRNRDSFEFLYRCDDDVFLKEYRALSVEYDHAALLRQLKNPSRPGATYTQVPRHQKSVEVYVESLFYNVKSDVHVHEDVFEILFVYHGTCQFIYEDEQRILSAGDFCIIAPGSRHQICVSGPDDFVIQQYIYTEHFRSSFVKILSEENILSRFFMMILTNREQSSYLLFSTPGTPAILQIARNLYLEQFKFDDYSPACTFFWTQLLFSNILREGIHSCQMPTRLMNLNFAPILTYLQENYKTATLSDVAEKFHYSTAYLSGYFKKITGSSYSSIVKDLKMKEASEYLLYTEKPIEEIASLTGYHSADHFSRVFRSFYHMAPSVYRREKGRKGRTADPKMP